MFLIIRIRGSVNMAYKLKDTLSMLNLTRTNHCIIVPKTKSYEGMLEKCKDFITWGEVSEENLKKLVLKRGRKPGNKKLEEKEALEIVKIILKEESLKNAKIKPIFRLSPPSKGMKKIKVAYPKGAVGYRGEKINKLLEKMM